MRFKQYTISFRSSSSNKRNMRISETKNMEQRVFNCSRSRLNLFLVTVCLVWSASVFPLWGFDLQLIEELDHQPQDGVEKLDYIEAFKINDGDIKVDGELEESYWQIAPAATGFVQFEPVSGKKATERTEVKLLYDEYNLYIGAILYDSNPDGIIADEMRRDSDLERNDSFMVILDTYHDHRNGFYFETNPLGAKADALVFDEGRSVNYDWDGVWWSEAKKTSNGWQVEIRIPFSTLRFNKKNSGVMGDTIWPHNPEEKRRYLLDLYSF